MKKRNIEKISFRKAKMKDMLIYFKWVNDNVTRKSSINSKKISFIKHKHWFIEKLKNKYSNLLIFKNQNKLIGQVRLDLKKKFLLIDYSIAKEFRGNGFGKKILSMAINSKKREKSSFLAIVKKNNVPSTKIFESLGFKKNIKDNLYYFKKNT